MSLEIAAVVAKALIGLTVKEGHDKLRKALKDDPMDAALKKGLADACEGFASSVRASFGSDETLDARLQVMMEDDAFVAAISELPFEPFRDLDSKRCRALFFGLGLRGAEEPDFDTAWRVLGRRWKLAAAGSPELSRLIEIARLDRIVETQTPRDDAPALARYRAALYERYRYADTRGLFMREKEGVGEGIELRDVFVESPLVRLSAPRKPRRERPDADEPPLPDAEDLLTEEAPALTGERLKIGQVIQRHRLTVVLGPPGSGKSTLLRCLAMNLCLPGGEKVFLDPAFDADVVPVFFELKVFASALQEAAGLQLDRVLVDRCGAELPGIEQLLAGGRALLLLDGLDEVFDERHRQYVSDEVWRLMTRFPAARFVLTSRPHGYAAAPLPGPVDRWQVAPFDEDGVRRFFHGWFTALAREGAEAGARENPEERARKLAADVWGRPRLRAMAENPLLCTLIVLVHRSRSGQLPERRVVFYEAAVRTLVESWERTKRTHARELDFPEPELLIRALAEVAWRALHELGRREIPRDRLHAWMRRSLEQDPEMAAARSARAVDDLLKLVQERTGLLVDLGADRYQFVHFSLHEYLAACFVLDRLSEAESVRMLRHYLHAPQWEEVLRLAVGRAGEARCEGLLGAVLGEPSSEWEGRLHRDLRFVMRCVGDRVAIGAETRHRIESRVLAALASPETLDRDGLVRDAAAMGPSPALTDFFRSELDDKDWRVGDMAMQYFGQLRAEDDKTRQAILKKFDDKNYRVRSAAIRCLAQLDSDDDETRRAVLRKLDDASGTVREAAIHYSLQIGADDVETLQAIARRLDDKDGLVRLTAVDYYVQLDS
jgi:energy-coupling factor transporter ATP-binding protein EcfA2